MVIVEEEDELIPLEPSHLEHGMDGILDHYSKDEETGLCFTNEEGDVFVHHAFRVVDGTGKKLPARVALSIGEGDRLCAEFLDPPGGVFTLDF